MNELRRWSRVLGETVSQHVRILCPGQPGIDGYLADQSADGLAVDLPPSCPIALGDPVQAVLAGDTRSGVVRHMHRDAFLLRVGIELSHTPESVPAGLTEGT